MATAHTYHPLVEHVYEGLKKSVSEKKEGKHLGTVKYLNLGIIEIDSIPIEQMSLLIDCCSKNINFGLMIEVKVVLSYHSVLLDIGHIEPPTDGTLLISKDEVEKVLNKIKKLKYNHAKGFHFPDDEHPPFEHTQLLSASFFKDDTDDVKTLFGECIVCTGTTKSRLQCCNKTLCVRCACKSLNKKCLRCPHCREEETFVYYDGTDPEYNDD